MEAQVKDIMRQINKIVVHVSDSPDTMRIGAKTIKKWHTDPPPKGNGWSDIGYHAVIRRSGMIDLGRALETPGAHVKGHNKDSIGVCWVGRDLPDNRQLVALIDYCVAMCKKFSLNPLTDIYGHKELDPGKTCPNLDMNIFRKFVDASISGSMDKDEFNVQRFLQWSRDAE